jgi:hypothetical protein
MPGTTRWHGVFSDWCRKAAGVQPSFHRRTRAEPAGGLASVTKPANVRGEAPAPSADGSLHEQKLAVGGLLNLEPHRIPEVRTGRGAIGLPAGGLE